MQEIVPGLDTAQPMDRYSASAAKRTPVAVRIENVIFYGFLAGLAVCPFWFGSNRLGAWGFNAMLFPGLVVALEVSLLASGRAHPYPFRKIMIPAVGFAVVVAWVLIQMSPLTPNAWHYPIWSMATDALSVPLQSSISVNVDLTMLALVRLLTAASVFWLSLQYGHDLPRAMKILELVALAGACYAAYGAISFIVAPNLILWFPKTAYLESVTSTFINRNNYAAYAGIVLVTCIAMAMHIFRRQVSTVGEKTKLRIVAMIAEVAGKGGYFLVCIFIISVALILTGSRGGITATVAGVIVLGILTGLRRSTGDISVIVIGLSLIALTSAFFVFGDIFTERLAATPGLKLDDASTDRVAVYAVTLQSIFDAPLSGFGYGTFADIFPLYRNSNIGIVGVWDKAHNTYLELLQGLGIPVAVIFFASVAVIIAACLRSALVRRRHATPPLVAVAASAIVLLHSLIDFSLQIQAITLTWCALLGTGLARSGPEGHSIRVKTAKQTI